MRDAGRSIVASVGASRRMKRAPTAWSPAAHSVPRRPRSRRESRNTRAHPLGAQREQLRRHRRRVADDLQEGVAVEQQMRRRRLHQPRRADQSGRLRLARQRIERHAGKPFRHQPHRALRHRIAEIGGAHLRLVGSRPRLRRRPAPPLHKKRPRHRRGLPPEPFHGLALQNNGHPCAALPLPLAGEGWGEGASAASIKRLRTTLTAATSALPSGPPKSRSSPASGRGNYATHTRGSAFLPSIRSVSAHTIASARSGDRPGPS
ncbi:hypothetical protein SAMN06295910_1590 [Allosphingosinicella indica]|uniref:Uncharacterized protein n=1 Tax=Allosphingosinicella indica TaxID=941907 RepID=A0A1X7GF78_9SPHN|nr:hypothetical protein SAMN06295910_1590 [Allosphingosinicella indica]